MVLKNKDRQGREANHLNRPQDATGTKFIEREQRKGKADPCRNALNFFQYILFATKQTDARFTCKLLRKDVYKQRFRYYRKD